METNEKTKKNGVVKVSIILILIVSILALVGFAYARYITRINGNAQAPVAKWSFDSKILNSAQTVEVSDFSVTRTDNNGDVNSETIAPGTSGEFIIEIDATGTETLLTYETKMTLTNKPKNLKFYWDSNKTQEIIVENETYLALNGFMSLSDNKKRDIPIYWDWPLETGSSPTEIEDNDEIDTTFIGKTMSMQIATTGTQVTSNPYANAVASTIINGNIGTYNTVQAAINAAGTNSGAVVTLLANVQENITIASGQNITLNTANKTLKSTSGNTIINRGTLNIIGNGNISSEVLSGDMSTIINRGVLTVNNVEIKSISYYAISNRYGTLTVNGATINSYDNAINNDNGTVNILSGTMRVTKNSYTSGVYIASGTINISGGAIYGTNFGIGIRGTANITGGVISGSECGIRVDVGGVVNLGNNSDEIIANVAEPIIIGNSKGVLNGGTFNFYDGIIKAPTGQTIDGTVNATPEGYYVINGTEEINETIYETAYLQNNTQ